jgi:hypothetical protein
MLKRVLLGVIAAFFVAPVLLTPGTASAHSGLTCTYTQGYWKTHSDRGPAQYEEGWDVLGSMEEDTPFFLSGKTWYEVFWTKPQGNPYYILAHQFAAAKLNHLNGTSVSSIQTTYDTAYAWLETHTPTSTLTAPEKQQVLAWASTLDQYNNGIIGPGHCDDAVVVRQ